MSSRRAGVLLHPTSLPGPGGAGDLGPAASTFLGWLSRAGQSVWQVLPLGPTDSQGSPYGGLSAFAGNPLLISPDRLLSSGLLRTEDFDLLPRTREEKPVDFTAVGASKDRLLRRAFERFEAEGEGELQDRFRIFRQAPEQRFWLEDWTLFSALRRLHRGKAWWAWPRSLADRDEASLGKALEEHRREVRYHGFVQFLFEAQWQQIRREAGKRGILLLGDVPIYPSLDSADVWAHRRLFQLDERGQPEAVAGVPPDDFSVTGQRWGNPLYDWQACRSEGFSWWVERVAADLRRVDRLRIDHFRGFAAYWRIPADAETAETGTWEPGPGSSLFDALEERLGSLPLLAENLGVITPQVEELRQRYHLPGMAVLQFAFSGHGMAPEHTPHELAADTVVYTGTHDNPTTASWYRDLSEATRRQVESYCSAHGLEIPWAMIRLAHHSAADLAIIPVQDLLALGDDGRMNTPGTLGGNWQWRLKEGALTPELAERLGQLTAESGRRSG